jgi:hypothetical protein
VPPGQHHLCSQAENRSVLTLKVEAGKTYFLQQHIENGTAESPQTGWTRCRRRRRKKLKDMNHGNVKVK